MHGLATLGTTLDRVSSIAVVFGLLLGILVGSFRLAYVSLYPLLIGFNSVPKAALVPVFVIWFGVGTVPAVLRGLHAVVFSGGGECRDRLCHHRA